MSSDREINNRNGKENNKDENILFINGEIKNNIVNKCKDGEDNYLLKDNLEESDVSHYTSEDLMDMVGTTGLKNYLIIFQAQIRKLVFFK